MNSALFLDRDGVINIDHGYVHTAEQTSFVPGIFELVRTANEFEMKVVVVTNQAGIGRGLYDEACFFEYMQWVKEVFLKHGARLDAVYHCPHHPTAGKGKYLEKCDCRKPQPGMLLQAARDHMLDFSRSVMVGDSETDAEAASAAGVGRIYLLGRAKKNELHAAIEVTSLDEVRSALFDMRASGGLA